MLKIMKKDILLSYSAPEFEVYEVAVEGGYSTSVSLPGFGLEEDSFC